MFSAPGRVNLIGEHTDYNDGFVLPIAIERRTRVAAAATGEQRVRVRSLDLGASHEFCLSDAAPGRRGSWVDLVEGMARTLCERGHAIGGADLMIQSDVPMGAGLSSSAALAVSVGLALASVAGLSLDGLELARAAQATEHNYVGTRCGIMDGTIVSLAQAGRGLLIDCRSLEVTPVPAGLEDPVLLVCNSGVQHRLASSEYNARRADCEHAVQHLERWYPRTRALRDVTMEMLSGARSDLPPPVFRRCRHVITENQRTVRACEALRAGDFESLGRLMYDSHASLRDDYEVSCAELDLLVDVAGRQSGVFGARLTGAGFGGCTLTLVRASSADSVAQELTTALQTRFGVRPELIVTGAGAGARQD